MSKVIIIILLVLAGGFGGYFIFKNQSPDFKALDAEEMHKRIIKERDYAINKAMLAGVYKCCIEPPCTMCYMEANQWNNETAGTCACDDLIVQGKDPCPQCERGLCDSNLTTSCLRK